ncbi:MAG: TIGR01212 family radical SAM protein [bacterium]
MTVQETGYNSYGRFLKEKFGTRVHKVPVNAGFTCPNRDGTVAYGGCTYCSIDSFTPKAASARIPIKQQVQTGIEFLKKRNGAQAFIVYFQPYSNTYASLEHLQRLYEQALDHPEVVGISVGTRPDCIDEAKLNYFEQLSQNYFVTIEYGIESVYDETLALINRGHDYACTARAIEATARRGLNVCGHVILGFPNETEQQMLDMASAVSNLPLSFLKIHNLYVARYTKMAREYLENPFPILTFAEWVNLVCCFLERLSPNIIIERLYGNAPRDLLIAPQWCREGSRVINAIQQELKRRKAYQGRLFEETKRVF